jgi:hypothetical protein
VRPYTADPVLLLVPGAAQVGDVVGHAPIERQHQRKGEPATAIAFFPGQFDT